MRSPGIKEACLAGVTTLTALTALTVLAPAARAEPQPVRLELRAAEALPFSRAELVAAVGARVPLAGPSEDQAPAILVGPGPEGRIEVASGLRRQEVMVADRAPPEAARLVALAVMDVMRDPLSSAPPLVEDTTAAPPRTPSPSASAGTRRGLASLAFLAGPTFGLAETGGQTLEPWGQLDINLGQVGMLRGAAVFWGVGVGGGYSRADAVLFGAPFVLETIPVRLGARLGWRWLEAVAGPALRLYHTSGLDSGRGTLAGAHLGLRASLPLFAGLRAMAAVACDGYTESVDFRAGLLTVVRTRHLMPWVGLGLGWGPRS